MWITSLIILLILTTVILFTKAEGRDRCFRQVSDVVIAIDSSFSIRSEEFNMQLSFLKALIHSFPIGQNHMRIGIVSFGSKVKLEIPLNKYRRKSSLKRAIGRIKHMNSGTYTHEAIRFVHSQMFKEKNGGRPWAKKKLVLITDGFASDLKKTLLEASRARVKGVEIFCIGVGNFTNSVELRGMASEPKQEHVFHVKNYESLSHIKAAVTEAACEKPMNDAAHSSSSTGRNAKECKHSKADVYFLMDSSNSIWRPDFFKYIGFIRQVTSTYNLGQDTIRIGLIVYSDRPTELLSLSDAQTDYHLNRVLDTAFYKTGGSNTARAIRYARTYGFASKYSRRPDAAKIMVILTDGKSDDQEATKREAKLANNDGIRTFAIGVGNRTDAKELMAMASDPDDEYVLHVDTFTHLETISDLLVMKTCDAMKDAMPKDEPVNPPICPSKPTDVVFVYDTTSLSLHYHNIVINTISDVTESDRLLTKNLRVGVIREVSKTRKLHDISLTDDWRRDDFKTKLDPSSTKSSPQLLLKRARKMWDDHWSHQRTIILFLESNLSNIFGASAASSVLKKSGVRIIVVGLGSQFNANQAIFLATHPVKENLIVHKQEQNEDNRSELVDKLIGKLC